MAKDNPIQAMKPLKVPTPSVGDTVLWYSKGDRSHEPYAAMVTEIESLGRVKLTVFPPSSMMRIQQNVNFLDMPKEFRAQQAKMYDQYGAWAWRNDRVPGGAYDLWNELEQQRLEREQREAAQREAEEKANPQPALT